MSRFAFLDRELWPRRYTTWFSAVLLSGFSIAQIWMVTTAKRPIERGQYVWVGILIVTTIWYVRVAVIDIVAVARQRRELRRRRAGRCTACGYDLRASAAGICPECGTHRALLPP